MVSPELEHKDQTMRKRRAAAVHPSSIPKREIRVEAKTTKQEHKVALTYAKAEKARAVASKRKMLIILLGIFIAIAAFFKFKIGG